MTTTISLVDMYFKSFHGYYPAERKMGNDFYLDVQVDVDTPNNYNDDIDKTINYENIYLICKREMDDTKLLLETVAQRILNSIKSDFPNVLNASVKIKKLGPQLGGKVKFSVVEIKF